MATIHPFSLPLTRPLETSRGTIEERKGLLVRTRGTPAGIGEATPLPGWTEPFDACRRALGRAVELLKTDEPAAALSSLAGTPAARHGLSLAFADRDARKAGQPLYRYLGGREPIERVPVNATVGDAPLEETVRAARGAVRRGFDCVKIKVGVRSIGEGLDRLGAVRRNLPDVELRVDANGAWSFDRARRVIDSMAELDVSYVEQPLPPDDLEGHIDLRGRGVGIALDETLATVPPAEILDAEAADTVVLKPMVLGGIRRARDVAVRARSAGVDPVVTTTVDAAVARTAAAHLAGSLSPIDACGLATADRLATDVGADPAPVENGTIRLPQDAGVGTAADETCEEFD